MLLVFLFLFGVWGVLFFICLVWVFLCLFHVFGFCLVVLLGFFRSGGVGRRLPCPDSPTLELTETCTGSTGVQLVSDLTSRSRKGGHVRLGEGSFCVCVCVGGGGGGGWLPWPDSPTLKLTKPCPVSTGVQRSASLFQSLPPAGGREVPGRRTVRGGAWLGAGPVWRLPWRPSPHTPGACGADPASGPRWTGPAVTCWSTLLVTAPQTSSRAVKDRAGYREWQQLCTFHLTLLRTARGEMEQFKHKRWGVRNTRIAHGDGQKPQQK